MELVPTALEGCYQVSPFFAKDERGIVLQRRRLDPMANARERQLSPWKAFAGIDLATGRDIGMGEHAHGRNIVASYEIAAKRDHPVDLPSGKMRQACGMAGVDDLDADGQRIDVGRAAP